MIIEFLTSRFSYILDGGLGIILFLGLIYLSNWSIGIFWSRDVWPAIKNDPNALARYFGWRLIALAIVVGLLAIAGAIQ